MDYTKMQIQIQILNMLLMKLSLVVHNWGKLKMTNVRWLVDRCEY